MPLFECFLDVIDANGQQYVNGEMLAGISVPVDLRQNVTAVQMRSEDGTEMTLSPFELYMTDYRATHNDFWNMEITWKTGQKQRITYNGIAGVDNGTTWGQFAVPAHEAIDSENVTGSIQFDGPEDWCGFIDVNEVDAFRFGNRIFYPVA